MKQRNEIFKIPVKGLGPGGHHYDFVVDDAFFEQFQATEIHRGKIHLSLDVEKESRLMTLMFHFNGSLQLVCDRCLEDYEQPLQGDFRLIVKYGEKEEEISDELVTIPFETSRFDLSPYISEFVQLMLPIKRVHPDDAEGNAACNIEMLQKLEKYAEPEMDSRWDALKNLKLQ